MPTNWRNQALEIATQSEIKRRESLRHKMRIFGEGSHLRSVVVIAVLVAGTSYLTQLFYGDEKKLKLAVRMHWLSAALGFATTGVFAAACVETYFAVRSMATNQESGKY